MTKKEWYELVLKNIETKFKRDSAMFWKNRDIEDLSIEIENETNVSLSVSTLKRIFGIIKTNEEYYPHQSTLEALVKYSEIRINNTRLKDQNTVSTYLDNNSSIENHELLPENDIELNRKPIDQNLKKKRIIFWGIASSFVCVTFGFFLTKGLLETNDNKNINFNVINRTKTSSYSTVLFGFDISKINDSVFLHCGNRKPVYLTKHSSSFSIFFNKPGRYNCFLKTKKSAISDTIPIFVQSKGWEAYINYFNDLSVLGYVYLKMEDIYTNSILHLDKSIFDKYKIDKSRGSVTHLINIQQTTVNGDNFVFETEMQILENINPSFLCLVNEFAILGEKNVIKFELTNAGCNKFSGMKISEFEISGNESLLEPLTFELNDYHNFKIINNNKHVYLMIDNKIIYQRTYQNSLGNISGVDVGFIGEGNLKSITLKKTENSQPIFKF